MRSPALIPVDWARDGAGHVEVTRSLWGVVRGLFLPMPDGTGTAVRVARGSAFLTAVDLRRESPTFAAAWWQRVHAVEPSWLTVPSGCAWGFQAMDDGTEVEELTRTSRDEMAPLLRWNDPALGIPWPLPARWLTPRELEAPMLRDVVR